MLFIETFVLAIYYALEIFTRESDKNSAVGQNEPSPKGSGDCLTWLRRLS